MADNLIGSPMLSRERRVSVATETTFNSSTLTKPGSTLGVRVLDCKISSPAPERSDVDENRATRSRVEQVTGGTPPIAWSMKSYLRPSGTAGTPPDCHSLLIGILADYTNASSTSDTYTVSDSYRAGGSKVIYEHTQQGMQMLRGAVVDGVKLSGSGQGAPMVEFNGSAASHALTGRSTCDGASSGGTVAVVDVDMFEVGSLVAFFDAADGTSNINDGGSDLGFGVTGISGSTLTLDGSPAASDGDIIAPHVLTSAFESGAPVAGVNGSVTIAGTSFPVTEYEFSVANNLEMWTDEVGEANATGYEEGFRDVTGSLKCKATAAQLAWLGKRKDFGTHAIVLTLGSGAGGIVTITVPTAELGFADIEMPEGQGHGTFSLPFKALGAANEIAVVFT